MNDTGPKTLLEAVCHFSDLKVCHDYMVSIKWPDGKITCPQCGGENVGTIATRRMFKCRAKGCRKQFSCKVGTLMEDSSLPISAWFVGIWAVANDQASSLALASALGITQKSAWLVLHRIRLAKCVAERNMSKPERVR